MLLLCRTGQLFEVGILPAFGATCQGMLRATGPLPPVREWIPARAATGWA